MEIQKAQVLLDKLLEEGLESAMSSGDENHFLFNSGLNYDSGCHKFCVFGEDFVIKFDRSASDHNCLAELENYYAAKQEGLEKFFTTTCFLTEIQGRTFIAQDRADIDEDEVEDLCYSYSGDYDPEDDETIYALCGCTPETERLVDFCQRYRINDLHSSNWGLDPEDKYVIIDYGGHHWDDDDEEEES